MGCPKRPRSHGSWWSGRRASGLSLGRNPLFEGARTMLMSSDDGGVDHRVFVVRIVSQRLDKTLPYAGLRPPREPRMNVLPMAEALSQIAPRRTRAKFPNHRFDEKPIAQLAVAAHVARPNRQQMFNPCKLVVALSVALEDTPTSRIKDSFLSEAALCDATVPSRDRSVRGSSLS